MRVFGRIYYCLRLCSPEYGEVQLSGITVESTATYSYDADASYTMIGESVRKCTSTGVWSGTEPRCILNTATTEEVIY